MKWLEISVQVDDEETAAPVCALFDLYGQGGSVEERILVDQHQSDERIPPPLTLKTYLPLNGTHHKNRRALEDGLCHLAEVYPLLAPTFRELDDQDWANAWRAHFQPQRVGQKLIFKLPEQDFDPGQDDLLIDLEPGMAFGTGLHPTTRMCLLCLEELLRPEDTVLDMGTGSGIQAIAAARLGAARVLALDNDPGAVRVASMNVSLNGLVDVVEVKEGSLSRLAETSIAPLDGIIVNIVAEVIAHMIENGLSSYLKSQGWLIAGGIIDSSEAMVRTKFEKYGVHVIARHQEEEWITLCATNGRAPTGSHLTREGV